MTINVPKTLLPGINREHLRLLDTKCKAEKDDTYYSLTTPLTACKTTRKHTTTDVVYSNMVLKVPTASKKAMIRELKIQFSCVHSSHGVVSSVGWRAVNRKVIISEEGKGNFTLVLNMFPDKKFEIPYKEEDFLLFVAQKRLFLEVSVISDKRMSSIADRCYTTPTHQRENAPKYEFISKGSANYPSVVYHSAHSINLQGFSIETAKFIGTDSFVFVQCHVIICDATDPDSQCAKKCSSGNIGKRQVSDHEMDEQYSWTQGPLLHVSEEKEEKESNGGASDEKNVGLVMICIACLAAMGTGLVIFKKLRHKRSAAEVFSGHEKEKPEH
ncbi:Oncoprotein-induced transcript 3 protein [Stylophora pistillata]|uniref:Oncoprotein-induced transcript 3 protein n=1 Tax=Stylophora pistillata TaxID=50429 RepID=A0A2B4RYI0_STYPI|nr:Oncoprotein-induced transcript 3 protein [Stylophora pistillata]